MVMVMNTGNIIVGIAGVVLLLITAFGVGRIVGQKDIQKLIEKAFEMGTIERVQ